MGLESLMPAPPSGERISVERKPVDAECPECGSTNVARYPVANFIGPRMVTKCQDCFHSLAVDVPEPDDHWPPWRSATADWPASRAG
jgi:ssDNA-binding Zn-finger/Zn-ribbon topoisomerase 1